jgi:hypothetical protein
MNEQCTYLGYVLLEAPREYVLHGPLLSINWLRLCPHLGGPCLKPRRPEEDVYSPNDSCSHFTQHLFPPKVPQQHTRIISDSRKQYHSHLLYITFIRTFTSFILYILFTYSLLRIFMAGWLPSAPCVRYSTVPLIQLHILYIGSNWCSIFPFLLT